MLHFFQFITAVSHWTNPYITHEILRNCQISTIFWTRQLAPPCRPNCEASRWVSSQLCCQVVNDGRPRSVIWFVLCYGDGVQLRSDQCTMEAAPRLPMISFDLKGTEPVSFGTKLKQVSKRWFTTSIATDVCRLVHSGVLSGGCGVLREWDPHPGAAQGCRGASNNGC